MSLLCYHQLTVKYPSGPKTFIITPERRRSIIALGRRNYKSAAAKIVTNMKTHSYAMDALVRQIRREMKTICSLKHNSILRDKHEAIQKFSWETIWLELKQQVPTLVSMVQRLLPKAENSFLSFVMCIILKKRCRNMCLLQRTISILLYANASNKQVMYYFIINMVTVNLNFRFTVICSLL